MKPKQKFITDNSEDDAKFQRSKKSQYDSDYEILLKTIKSSRRKKRRKKKMI